MPETPRLVLITGMSGAGKSRTLHVLEDIGYFCVDNLPASLVAQFGELVLAGKPGQQRVAICVDARSGEDLRELPDSLDALRNRGLRIDVLYLDTANDVLVRRYSETRRKHPASPDGTVEEGIAQERELLAAIHDRADLVLDTSRMSLAELRERIASLFDDSAPVQRMTVLIESFGFKFGVPPEADLMFDVRFLPNPHWINELRERTGNEEDVRNYVLENTDGIAFFEHLKALLEFLMPRYEKEPKAYLTIAIGCTGGKHRSVAVANKLAMFLRDLGMRVRLRHRDIEHTVSGGI